MKVQNQIQVKKLQTFALPLGTYSTSELPDYLISYVTIISSEQRECYEQEFRVDYEEYKALHEKLLPFSKIFVSLTSKKEQFTPDSREYEAINKKISLEYQKMKQMSHNYFEEKLRCQYLYNKLAHIKELINNYDQQCIQSQPENSSRTRVNKCKLIYLKFRITCSKILKG